MLMIDRSVEQLVAKSKIEELTTARKKRKKKKKGLSAL
jgi:hypothetical protein